jgi:hypothetical protein
MCQLYTHGWMVRRPSCVQALVVAVEVLCCAIVLCCVLCCRGPSAVRSTERLRHAACWCLLCFLFSGSEPGYAKSREKFGGKAAVGGARDRDSGELRFSLRSLQKFLPWWRGEIFIVSPGQTPYWMNTSHPRVHIVNQDELYPPDDRQFLPTFNTNSLEQWLCNTPGLPESSTMFIHMNDDYLFTAPISPQDLFGPSCSGVRVLVENRAVRSVPEEDYLHQLETQSGRTWPLSVLHSIVSLDKHYNRERSVHPYLKHGPFIYFRQAMHDITTEMFREETIATSTHKFRSPEDVVRNASTAYAYLLACPCQPSPGS